MAAAKKAAASVVSLDQIRAADDTHAAEGVLVAVPEWGGSVRVRGLTRGEARSLGDGTTPADAEVFTLQHGLVEPAVTAEEAAVLLDEKGFAATERVLVAILDLSGLTPGFREGKAD